MWSIMVLGSFSQGQAKDCLLIEQNITGDYKPTKTVLINSELGGTIQVRHVTLYVPPNALSNDQLVTVSLNRLNTAEQYTLAKIGQSKSWTVTIKAALDKSFTLPLILTAKPIILPVRHVAKSQHWLTPAKTDKHTLKIMAPQTVLM